MFDLSDDNISDYRLFLSPRSIVDLPLIHKQQFAGANCFWLDATTFGSILRFSRLSQIIFHVTTMMPTVAHDPSGTAKKRHIGNDYVLVIWNEGGTAFDRETIPGQFNLCQIIIESCSTGKESFEESNFLVSVSYRNDMNLIPPLPFMVAGSSLGSIVRQTAILCNMISQVFSTGEVSSNSKERLRQVKRMQSRLERPTGTPLDFTILSK